MLFVCLFVSVSFSYSIWKTVRGSFLPGWVWIGPVQRNWVIRRCCGSVQSTSRVMLISLNTPVLMVQLYLELYSYRMWVWQGRSRLFLSRCTPSLISHQISYWASHPVIERYQRYKSLSSQLNLIKRITCLVSLTLSSKHGHYAHQNKMVTALATNSRLCPYHPCISPAHEFQFTGKHIVVCLKRLIRCQNSQ